MSGAVGVHPCTFNAIVQALLNDGGASVEWSHKWPILVCQLDLDPQISHDIRRNITLNQKSITEALSEILLEWRSKESHDATLDKLVNILNNMQMRRAVTSLKSTFPSSFENLEDVQQRNANHENNLTAVNRSFSRSESTEHFEANENQRCLTSPGITNTDATDKPFKLQIENNVLCKSKVWNARTKPFVSVFVSVVIILGIAIGVWFLKFHNQSKSQVNLQAAQTVTHSSPGSAENTHLATETTQVTRDIQTSEAFHTTTPTTERQPENLVFVEQLSFNEIIKRLNRFQGDQIVLVLKISTENITGGGDMWSFTYNTTVAMPCIEIEGPFTSHSLANFLRSTTIETSWLKLVRNQFVCCSTLPDTETSCWDKNSLRSMKSDDLEKLITTHIEKCVSK